MERVKIVLCGLAILSFLFAFGVPVAHAQNLDRIMGQAQFKTSIYTHAPVAKVTEGGKGYVMLFENGFASICSVLGFSYDIVLIENPDQVGAACALTLIGFLDTCSGETSAVGFIGVDEIPESSTNYAECFFNGPVTNFQKFSSKGGECDLYDAGDNWIGISKKATMKFKEKNLAKKVKCTMP